MIKKTSFVLSHGVHLIATAEDAFNPSEVLLPNLDFDCCGPWALQELSLEMNLSSSLS